MYKWTSKIARLCRKRVKRQVANLLSNISEPAIFKLMTIYHKALMNWCKPTIYYGVNKLMQIDNL